MRRVPGELHLADKCDEGQDVARNFDEIEFISISMSKARFVVSNMS